MRTRIILSIVLFAAAGILEFVAERIFPFGELFKMLMPIKA